MGTTLPRELPSYNIITNEPDRGVMVKEMDLTGHLLYIDITQICGIGCNFCMYSDKHQSGASMALSDQARTNLRALINAPSVKRVSVSGEGEPLNNVKIFHEILGLSTGGRAFEFITSGFLPHPQLSAFYDTTNALAQANGDTCNIRLSADSYHIEKVKHRAHGFSARYWLARRPAALQFSFRSVDTDRAFTRRFLLDEFASNGLEARLVLGTALQDALIAAEATFGIEYKNHVHPHSLLPGQYLDLYAYIDAIETRYEKPFTLGSLNRGNASNGMDVTIKPNGDVHFYGAETVALGNIHTDNLSWETLAARLRADPLARTLYTVPFVELISKIQDDPVGRNAIRRANNPYWLIKELAANQDLLNKMVAA